MPSGFFLDLSHMSARAAELDPKIRRGIFGVAKYWDGKIERAMKHNAPWHDRTSNARNGLAARAVKLSKSVVAIILSHAVDYGIYLEKGTRNMRARPIIIPSIDLFAPQVMEFLNRLMDRLDKGE